MKIAISGASGFVGGAFAESCAIRGVEILTLDRSISTNSGNSIAWDPERGLTTPEALDGVDVLVHLAGKSIAGRWTDALRQEIRDSRVEATSMLAEQLSQLVSPPQTVISISATGIYGSRGSEVLTEESDFGDDFLAAVARDWEHACEPLRKRGIRVVHPRLGIVLDPSGGALQRVLPFFKWGLGGKLGDGQQYWPWISLRDCLRLFWFLIEHESLEGPFNAVAPQETTNKQFTDALGSALSRPVILPVPRFALHAAMGEMADALLLGSQRVQPKRLIESGFEFEDQTIAGFFGSCFSDS